MGRMLNSKVLPARVEPRYALRPPQAAADTTPLPTFVPAASESIRDKAERQNALRKIALYASLGFLFLRLTAVSELLTYYTHYKFYLLYLFAPLAILGVLTTGGIGRTLRHDASKYWIAFYFWMVLATPFSSWKGSSVELIYSYTRVQLAMLFVAAGLAMTWKEVRLILYALAVTAVADLGTQHLFGNLDDGGRINLEASGNIGNSNDLGALLLLVLPFLMFVVMDRARSTFVRICLLPALGYGVWVVLGTGSRGCMIAMVAMFLFAMWRASRGQRAAILAAGVVSAIVIPALLPGSILKRLTSLRNEDTVENSEALESSAARQYLLKQSIVYTVQHPIFGVGPGQFPNYEGKSMVAQGKHGQWKVTHNFLTQISSECGIPAVIFVILSLGSALLLVNRTYLQARKKGARDIANACFCYQLGMVGYLCSVIFLAQAYHPYLPMMVGLAISMSLVALRQMSASETSAAAGAALPLTLR